MSRSKKIVRALPKGVRWRQGVTSCPHCQHDFGHNNVNQWVKNAVALVLDEIQCKHGSIAFVSECPQCFKKSWCHN